MAICPSCKKKLPVFSIKDTVRCKHCGSLLKQNAIQVYFALGISILIFYPMYFTKGWVVAVISSLVISLPLALRVKYEKINEK